MRRDGRTLVLVSHDVRFAAQVADAAIVLSDGRIARAFFDTPPDAAELERAYLAAERGTRCERLPRGALEGPA